MSKLTKRCSPRGLCLLLALGGLGGVPVLPGAPMDQGQVEAYRQRLRDPDPQARVAAMEVFTDALFRGEALATGDQRNLLPLLVPLLDDPEVQVRRRAAVCLAGLAYANSPKLRRGRAPATDLRGFPGLQEALGNALLNDPDDGVRDSALSAYAPVFVLPPEMQDALVEGYGNEKKFAGFGNKILYSLLIDNAPTPKATALLERLADEPASCIQIAQMLRGFGRVPPGGLLAKFVRFMRVEDQPSRRDLYFFAVVEYRPQAKPYLEDLEKVKEMEPSPVTQRNMGAAIQAVRDER